MPVHGRKLGDVDISVDVMLGVVDHRNGQGNMFDQSEVGYCSTLSNAVLLVRWIEEWVRIDDNIRNLVTAQKLAPWSN